MKTRFSIFLLTAVLLLLSACSNNNTAQQTIPSNSSTANVAVTSSPVNKSSTAVTKIEVTEKEMEVNLSSKTAPAGAIEFVVYNKGQEPHEMEIVKTDLPLDKLPLKEGGRLDTKKAGQKIAEIEADELGSGATKTLRTNLTPGTYLIECNLPGHFKAGMKTVLTVS